MTEEIVEVRCPSDLRRLFQKLRFEGGKPTMTDGNLMELSCSDCTREQRRAGKDVRRVLHRYNFVGVLIETVLVYKTDEV